jgi:hypothetical protein
LEDDPNEYPKLLKPIFNDQAEVGPWYHGRTYQGGKKINWQDGLRAVYVILKYGLFQRKANS